MKSKIPINSRAPIGGANYTKRLAAAREWAHNKSKQEAEKTKSRSPIDWGKILDDK